MDGNGCCRGALELGSLEPAGLNVLQQWDVRFFLAYGTLLQMASTTALNEQHFWNQLHAATPLLN